MCWLSWGVKVHNWVSAPWQEVAFLDQHISCLSLYYPQCPTWGSSLLIKVAQCLLYHWCCWSPIKILRWISNCKRFYLGNIKNEGCNFGVHTHRPVKPLVCWKNKERPGVYWQREKPGKLSWRGACWHVRCCDWPVEALLSRVRPVSRLSGQFHGSQKVRHIITSCFDGVALSGCPWSWLATTPFPYGLWVLFWLLWQKWLHLHTFHSAQPGARHRLDMLCPSSGALSLGYPGWSGVTLRCEGTQPLSGSPDSLLWPLCRTVMWQERRK